MATAQPASVSSSRSAGYTGSSAPRLALSNADPVMPMTLSAYSLGAESIAQPIDSDAATATAPPPGRTSKAIAATQRAADAADHPVHRADEDRRVLGTHDDGDRERQPVRVARLMQQTGQRRRQRHAPRQPKTGEQSRQFVAVRTADRRRPAGP